MMGLALDVLHLILLHLPFKACFAPPVGVLPPIISQHFLGHTVLCCGLAVGFQNILCCLAAEQAQPNYIATVIVNKTDQVNLSATQTKAHNVGLPQLIGCTSLKESRFDNIFRASFLRRFHQTLSMQHFPRLFPTAGQSEPAT